MRGLFLYGRFAPTHPTQVCVSVRHAADNGGKILDCLWNVDRKGFRKAKGVGAEPATGRV